MTAIADLPDIRPSLLLDFANSGRVDPRIECTRASSATCFGPDGKLRTVPANTPRIDYDPATGKCAGLLVEEARTNLLIRSTPTASTGQWNPVGTEITPAFDIAPNGSQTSVKVTSTITTAGASTYLSAGSGSTSYTEGKRYTASCYVRFGVNTSNWSIRLMLHGSAFGVQRSVLISPSGVGSSSGSPEGYGIQQIGNGWYRIWVSHPAASSLISWAPILWPEPNMPSGDSFEFWGCQLEEGTYPTSYIPTEGAAVTRSTDKVSVPYTTAGAGALFVHGSYDVAASSVFFPVRARSEGIGYIGTPYCLPSGVVARSGYVRNNGGSPSVALAPGANLPLGPYKSVISWSGKSFANSINGTISNSITHELEFPICTRIDLCTASSSGPVLGASHIFQIAGYGAQLSPQNMQRLTA